jgi:Ca-activated chloride channel family protein
MEENYFNLLSLPEDATTEEIRNAYHVAARKYHPDRNNSSDAAGRFREVQEAFEILSYTTKRDLYREKVAIEIKKSPVTLKKAFSSKSLALLNEKQLLYVLFEIDCDNSKSLDSAADLELCLIVDYSTSMSDNRLGMVKSSISHLVTQMKQTNIISIVGFSDFAELIVPPVLVEDYKKHENNLGSIKAHGATELLKGLELGISTFKKDSTSTRIRRLILLTDGHTYGDEDACLELAKKASEKRISIYALGFGDKWNDEFLDRVTSCSGGNASFVANNDELKRLLSEKTFSASYLYAQQLSLEYKPAHGSRLNYIFRLIPDASPLSIQDPLQLGNLYYNERMLLLFEFLIDPIKVNIEQMEILKGKLWLDIPSNNIKCERYFIDWNRPVTKLLKKAVPPESIVHAISRLTLYRMQEKARKDVEQKKYREASKKLNYLASQLFSQGEYEFAKTVLFEASQVERTGNFSQDGDKRIKYGTRSLLLQSGLESE